MHPLTTRLPFVALLLAIPLVGCGKPPREPITLVFLNIGPWHNPEYAGWTQGALEGFTRDTGVIVKRLPAPRESDEQLVFALVRYLSRRDVQPERSRHLRLIAVNAAPSGCAANAGS